MTLTIRPATADDRSAIWAILEPVFRKGETYALPRDITCEDALTYWFGGGGAFVAEQGDRILGSYYIRANQKGGGAHVCNCGFATAVAARGMGVARAMLAHALDTAKRMEFRAMQFNFVVATNLAALKIWFDNGFTEAGRLPGAFLHPKEGFVDALVLFRKL